MQFVPSFIVQWLKSQWHPKSWTFSGNFLVIYSLLFPMKTLLFYKHIFWNYNGSYYCIYYWFYSHKIHWRIENHCHSQSTEPNSQSTEFWGLVRITASRGSAEEGPEQRTQKQALNLYVCVCVSCSVLSDSLTPHGL